MTHMKQPPENPGCFNSQRPLDCTRPASNLLKMRLAPQKLQKSPNLRLWWDSPAALAALILLSTVPLLWPNIPPLNDLPGHMGRYRIQLDLAESPALQRFYDFEWELIGNLGVDLLVELLAPVFGLEATVKLIVLSIPPLTVIGLLWIAREVHGRTPPTSLFAIPFAYNFAFLYGFVNFALSMALALNFFALWLRLANRPIHRAIVFVPASMLLWLTHAFGWGALGVLAYSAEMVRQFDRSQALIPSAFRSALHVVALAPPIAFMLLWRSDAVGSTGLFLNLWSKLRWILMALRDRWELFDLASLAIAAAIIIWALIGLRFSRKLFIPVALLGLVYILLPQLVFGSDYADMRLAPYLFAIALIAIQSPRNARLGRALAIAGLMFAVVRIGANTISFWIYDRSYDRQLAALEHVPSGARVVSFVGRACDEEWAKPRLFQLPSLAIVRRHAFSNDQWAMQGAQLLDVHYTKGEPFTRNPSQVVTQRQCGVATWLPIDQALEQIPRGAFDFVWLIKPPQFDPILMSDWEAIWRGEDGSILYAVKGNPSGD